MPKNPGRKAPASTPERRHWLRLALSSIADAVLIADRDGRVVFLNPAAESLIGWPAKDARGAPLDAVFRVVSEETRQPVESPGARALRLGSAMGAADSALLIARDGTERPIELSSAPFRDAGGIAGVALVFRDVTERRRSEQALRQSEERFRLMVESVKDYAIFMLNPQGHVASWNAGAERIKGYRADEIIGKHFSCFYPEEAVASGWPQTELELAVADGRFEDEGWRIRQDGSRFWANVVITAVVDHEGRLKGFAKVTRDLTERQGAEAELRATQVQAAALDEVNRRKDEFLAMLGHELRNPLAPILNAVHLLALQPGSADPSQARARSMIERQVGQLSRLVDDLLEVSRIGRGLIRLEQEDVDLREVVGRALDSTRPLLEQRRHELINNWPLEPIWVHGDPTRLEQVVLNLLNNAAKYTEEGGRIAVGVAQEGGRAVVRVKDNGVGIPPELLPRIFELFTQAERSLDRAQGGMGIGLTLVQKLVELHGGSVEAHSQPGEGSEFVVSLPLVAEPTRQAQVPETEPQARPARALRVLVVDDNVDQAESMAMLLRAAGQEVRVVYSGAHALETAAEYRPQVVLLDIGLPELDGYEIARRLRQDPLVERLPLIAMTGYGQDADRQRSLAAGFDHHLVKPADPQRLRELLEQLGAEAD